MRIDARTEARSMLLGEPIHLVVIVSNASSASVLFPASWTEGRFALQISKGGESTEVNPFLAPIDASSETVVRLAPGGKYGTRCEIQSYLNDIGTYAILARLTSSGEYRDTENQEPLLRPCWAGQMESNTVSVSVSAPSTADDQAALRILAGPNYELGQYDLGFGRALQEKSWAEVLRRYPRSTYAQYCNYYVGMGHAHEYVVTGLGEHLVAAEAHLRRTTEGSRQFRFRDDAFVWLAALETTRGAHAEAEALLRQMLKEHPKSDIVWDPPSVVAARLDQLLAQLDMRERDEAGAGADWQEAAVWIATCLLGLSVVAALLIRRTRTRGARGPL
jgi:hypothetical protein